MNVKMIGKYLGRILTLNSLCMVPPLFIGLFLGEFESFWSFLVAIGAQMLVAILLMLVPVKDKTIYAKEGMVIVALSWIFISLFGALPFYFSRSIPSFVDALFETVSGFTTTGASVVANVEILPKSILFWRSFTHWLGGMGVLVLILAIAPSHGGSGMPLHILRAESPGPVVGKLAPKLSLTVRILYTIYVVLTLMQLVFLLCGGMPFFDALLTSFGTAGTGGFGIKNDSMASYSPYIQTVTASFMVLFAINFSIYFLVLMKDWRGVLKNTELRVFLFIVAASTFGIAFMVQDDFGGQFPTALRHAFFQVSSIISTSGFATVNYELWPELAKSIIVMLMLIGACAGSTGGGFKVSRIVILWKSIKADIKKILHPRSVTVPTMDGKALEKTVVERCFTFLFIYVAIFAVSVLLLSIEGLDFTSNFTAVSACLNNIGPGFGEVGPASNFGGLAVFSKVVLIFDMLLGRLEIFPLLLILLPSTWRKAS